MLKTILGILFDRGNDKYIQGLSALVYKTSFVAKLNAGIFNEIIRLSCSIMDKWCSTLNLKKVQFQFYIILMYFHCNIHYALARSILKEPNRFQVNEYEFRRIGEFLVINRQLISGWCVYPSSP